MGMIEHVWHPNTLRLSKRVSTHRLIYGNGWHGGNRDKSPSLYEDDDTWGGCGLCGELDLQDHWISTYQFEEVPNIYHEALLSARETVNRIPSTKGNHQNY